jgi:hypothetical protein
MKAVFVCVLTADGKQGQLAALTMQLEKPNVFHAMQKPKQKQSHFCKNWNTRFIFRITLTLHL